MAENLSEKGRLLLRESGTEPLIRVMVEAETDEMCRENVDVTYSQFVKSLVKSHIGHYRRHNRIVFQLSLFF